MHSWQSTCSRCRSRRSVCCRATPTAPTALAVPARARCLPAARPLASRPSAPSTKARTRRPRSSRRQPPTSNTRRAALQVAGTDHGVDLFDLAAKQTDGRIFVDSTSSVAGPTWPNGCHICEIEVDPDTGETAVVSYASVNDVGPCRQSHDRDRSARRRRRAGHRPGAV